MEWRFTQAEAETLLSALACKDGEGEMDAQDWSQVRRLVAALFAEFPDLAVTYRRLRDAADGSADVLT